MRWQRKMTAPCDRDGEMERAIEGMRKEGKAKRGKAMEKGSKEGE